MQRRRRLASVVAAGLAAGLVLAACGAEEEEPLSQGFEDCLEEPATCNSGETQDGGSMTWVISVSPDAWMGGSAAGGSIYSLQTAHGLLPYTGDGDPDATYEYNMDLLAAEPELLSEDPFQYQFQLREDAQWDDGTPITADDFRVTWYMSTAEEEGHCVGCTPRATAGTDDIASIEGSDNGKTVTITLKEGISDPEYFASFGVGNIWGGILPAHVAGQQGWDIETPEDVGEYFQWLHETRPEWSGGPWKIVDGDLDTEVIKEPNENYWGEPPPLDTLVISYNTEDDTWLNALDNEEIHGASPPDINPDLIEQLRGAEGVRVHVSNGPSWEHMDVNLDVEQLQDVELRRAIFNAVDVDDIANRNFGSVFPDYELRRNYSFSQSSPHFEDHIEGTGYGSGDIEEARRILEEAGYEGFQEGETLTLDGEEIGPFSLTSTDTEPRNTAKLLVQDALAQIGIEIQIETTDALGDTLAGGDYELIVFGWSGNPALFVNNANQYAASDSASNFGGYENPEYDELANAAVVADTFEESADLLNQAYELLVPDAYILPFYNTPVYIFVTEEYVNVRDNCCSSLRGLYNSYEWGLSVE